MFHYHMQFKYRSDAVIIVDDVAVVVEPSVIVLASLNVSMYFSSTEASQTVLVPSSSRPGREATRTIVDLGLGMDEIVCNGTRYNLRGD